MWSSTNLSNPIHHVYQDLKTTSVQANQIAIQLSKRRHSNKSYFTSSDPCRDIYTIILLTNFLTYLSGEDEEKITVMKSSAVVLSVAEQETLHRAPGP